MVQLVRLRGPFGFCGHSMTLSQLNGMNFMTWCYWINWRRSDYLNGPYTDGSSLFDDLLERTEKIL